MPRFVILEHDHPTLHWDLMLEAGDVLQTWRLAQAPNGTAIDLSATSLADHRLMYLDYEGPVNGNRGSVRRWDVGTYTEEADSRPDARCCLLLGTRVRGRIRLERTHGSAWLFRYGLTV